MDERIQVKGTPGRCPFCHDEVPPDQRVACAVCLAAHHAGCWDEHGRCSSCGQEKALRPEGETTPSPRPELDAASELQVEAEPPNDQLVTGMLLLVVVAIIALLVKFMLSVR